MATPLAFQKQNELVRERETFRYDPSLIANSILNSPDDLIPSDKLTTSHDATLTSFCQLAAIRLNASRALVSLFDRTNQFVVAEATQHNRLLPNSGPHGFWLCGTNFTRSFGVCERVVVSSATSSTTESPITVINDLAQDEILCLRPYCHAWPNNRFYAGIPLTTPRGIVIGVLCVFDSQPRTGLDDASKIILQDLAQSIMTHLEDRRVRERYRQADRVTRGIRHFFHGRTSKTQLQHDRLLATEPRLRTPGADFSPRFNHSSNIKGPEDRLSSTCASATDIMRDALEVDGLLLLDASRTHRSPGTEGPRSAGTSKNDKLGVDDLSSVLSSSVAADSHQDATSYFGHSSLPTSILKSLLHHYPRGTIWTFSNIDEDASDNLSDDASSEVSDHDHASEESDEQSAIDSDHTSAHQLKKAIMALLPGATSVAFFPIWNAQKRRWFAGGFAYTNKASRVFSPKRELSYLRALGAVLMAEVSFIKERQVEFSKLDVLDSISHELRSPLHGIFFGAGVLRAGRLNQSQDDALLSVEACSRTLLDTIDQILDWSKINHFTTSLEKSSRYTHTDVDSRTIRSSRNNSIEAGMMSIASDVDLPHLIEDVVESVHLGHEFQKQTLGSSGDKVELIVNFEPGSNWKFHVQPGAIRRIIMNILGNSLRFTSTGTIHVQVEQSETDDASVRLVKSTISDTGCGMSPEFLANDVFSPFTQQNIMDAGTGLGLSIVRRITQALGGNVEVQSAISVGTAVRVSLPLKLSEEPVQDADASNTVPQPPLNKDLEGLRVCVMGFEDPGAEIATVLAWNNLTSDRDTISAICSGWLALHLVELPVVQDQVPQVVICDESSLDNAKVLTQNHKSTSIVVICRNAVVARKLESAGKVEHNSADNEQSVIFTHRPVGPRKLQRILSRFKQSKQQTQRPTPKRRVLGGDVVFQRQMHPPTPPSVDCEKPNVFTTGLLDLPTPVTPSEGYLSPKPLHSPAITPSEKESHLCDTTSSEEEMFLLVDDNPINLKMLVMFMKKLKMRYSTATHGQEAVDKYKANPRSYKCVFMDISMPIMNGFEATRCIRAFAAESGVPRCSIFALTGLASCDAQQEAVLSGIDLFLTKPITLVEIRQLLESKELI
ncbi:atpase- atp-binding domain [Fusarium longipes]|uniref:Atpase-atp-binding domain n=1 Tax=Fusarium longipes TaxID=694270 RepID=A0A395T2R2_9HYPO|nr:atpase- atp-binding domain [Fusarium longipes]